MAPADEPVLLPEFPLELLAGVWFVVVAGLLLPPPPPPHPEINTKNRTEARRIIVFFTLESPLRNFQSGISGQIPCPIYWRNNLSAILVCFLL